MYTPSRRDFLSLTRTGHRVPVAHRCPLETSADLVFESVFPSPPHILLESARFHPNTGRYSILVGEPDILLIAKGNKITLQQSGERTCFEGNPLILMQQLLDAHPTVRIDSFPPFIGGAVGFLGFGAYQYCESISSSCFDDLGLPDLVFLFCDQAIVMDHEARELWAIALSRPEARDSYGEAIARVDELVRRSQGRDLQARLADPPCRSALPVVPSLPPMIRYANQTSGDHGRSGLTVPSRLAPCDAASFKSTHTKGSFERMVREAKKFIADGEIYQANLSQRFSIPLTMSPWDFYRRLKNINPSPFAAFADFSGEIFGAGFQVVSASPERFVRVQGRKVETRPIAGTRRRGMSQMETNHLRQELLLNEKERAEHLMLVDLERNDLGRICSYGSVCVDELMSVEEYSHVIHIVSNVRGILNDSIRPADLIRATFPGGTITGCPKIRCIEIIERLEPVRRQLYTGSLGYISYTGDMDFNLLIRTAAVTQGQVYIQTGAGIVADSDPGKEYEETLHKAQALMEALHADSEETVRNVSIAP